MRLLSLLAVFLHLSRLACYLLVYCLWALLASLCLSLVVLQPFPFQLLYVLLRCVEAVALLLVAGPPSPSVLLIYAPCPSR